MTNHWNDLQNADVILAIGCNPAENHPISFKWITKAMEKVAASKLRRAQTAAEAARPYAERMSSVLGNLASGITVGS